MRLLVIVASLAAGFVVALFVWRRWDSGQNHGSSFGYYGEYNRVSNALVSIPGVVITQHWHNLDITLEEFGFDVTVTGRPVHLYFGEGDPVRKMSRATAAAAVRRRIDAQLSAPNANN